MQLWILNLWFQERHLERRRKEASAKAEGYQSNELSEKRVAKSRRQIAVKQMATIR